MSPPRTGAGPGTGPLATAQPTDDPRRWIRGQTVWLRWMQGALATDRIAHAVAWYGPAGGAADRLALAWAQAVICPAHHVDPPLDCAACRRAARGLHPDLVVFSAEGSIGIDAVRDLEARALRRPLEADRVVFVILGADAMTADAQNAMLRILEEPPPATCFSISARGPDHLLATVRSRLQSFTVRPISRANVVSFLQEQGVDATRAEALGSPADGSLERAQRFLALEPGAGVAAATSIPALVESWLADPAHWLDVLELHYRSLRRCVQDPSEPLMALHWIETARRDLEHHIHPRLALEALAVRLKVRQGGVASWLSS